jgi:Secretion system C-terminal sorting domain/Electron transfer DM13
MLNIYIMKNSIFLILFIFLGFSNTIKAQCSRAAASFGNNTGTPTYNITGGVEVVLNTNNTVTLNLASNFMTASGPDVRAYLVNPETRTTDMLKAINATTFPSLPKIVFGIVSDSDGSPVISPNGAKNFTVPVPTGVNISNYTKVFFYCQMFNAFWDMGTITNFTTANCSVLSTDSFEKNSFKLYPNPVDDELSFDFNQFQNDFSVKVYNTLGSIVLTENTISNQNNKLNTSGLNAGIYFVELNDKENNRYVQRFIKR